MDSSSKETKPEELWVGEEKDTGQLWLYDPLLSEDRAAFLDGDIVDLFHLEDRRSNFQYTAPPGKLEGLDRTEYRKKLRTVKDPNRRKGIIDAYIKWFRYQDFYGDNSSADAIDAGYSEAHSDRIYVTPVFYSDS